MSTNETASGIRYRRRSTVKNTHVRRSTTTSATAIGTRRSAIQWWVKKFA